jgi:hypothetical protein
MMTFYFFSDFLSGLTAGGNLVYEQRVNVNACCESPINPQIGVAVMKKSTAKRAFLGIESLERRELLSGNTASSVMPALTAPPAPSTALPSSLVSTATSMGTLNATASTQGNLNIDTAYLLVPTPVSSRSGSTVSVTNTPIQIIVPPDVLNTLGTNGSTTPPGEAPITLQFNGLTGPVDVQLNSNRPQDVATFLDYVESGAFDNALFARLGLAGRHDPNPFAHHDNEAPNYPDV